MKKVRITRTSTTTYDISDGDFTYYAEHGAVNADMAVLADIGALEEGDLEWDELEGAGDEFATEYKAEWIEGEAGSETYTPVNESNEERDAEFCKHFEDDEDDQPDGGLFTIQP